MAVFLSRDKCSAPNRNERSHPPWTKELSESNLGFLRVYSHGRRDSPENNGMRKHNQCGNRRRKRGLAKVHGLAGPKQSAKLINHTLN
ncbi:hypothetical protein RRG08_051203 [Elysia crispata]|uniref:Uncharacterized protein n=1 Tax=Elysia crispata TaxID=231223 RepID=A0AAE1DAU7_9GAST|nr:hypothetical protein RRG08_051203 [Elysia crispata]